ncbi:hypothetical protein BD410DRAFT_590344 [Rickenella mellea]|uniref:RGS domain-containing protein n=1 Tax=Rickenella mellea TaxID=50990 RepID=A0A4Y7PPD8_9AGAM|nr:hypothetical protein BD410DRAFT_590344 [Rickenella mellea]
MAARRNSTLGNVAVVLSPVQEAAEFNPNGGGSNRSSGTSTFGGAHEYSPEDSSTEVNDTSDAPPTVQGHTAISPHAQRQRASGKPTPPPKPVRDDLPFPVQPPRKLVKNIPSRLGPAADSPSPSPPPLSALPPLPLSAGAGDIQTFMTNLSPRPVVNKDRRANSRSSDAFSSVHVTRSSSPGVPHRVSKSNGDTLTPPFAGHHRPITSSRSTEDLRYARGRDGGSGVGREVEDIVVITNPSEWPVPPNFTPDENGQKFLGEIQARYAMYEQQQQQQQQERYIQQHSYQQPHPQRQTIDDDNTDSGSSDVEYLDSPRHDGAFPSPTSASGKGTPRTTPTSSSFPKNPINPNKQSSPPPAKSSRSRSGSGGARTHLPAPASLENLGNWAPANQIPSPTNLPHLPDWPLIPPQSSALSNGHVGGVGSASATSHGSSTRFTSLPNSIVQRDIDYTMRRLINEKVFADLVMDPLGRHRFREYLLAEGDTSELDLWFDSYNYTRLIEDVKMNGEAFRDIYLTEGSDSFVSLPQEVRREVLAALRKLVNLDTSFESTQRHLLHKMYHHQFQRFVKHKLIQETQVMLGKHNLSTDEQEGLGDCFCLTNPRLPDHPIVLVSDGFVGVTGYPKNQIVGRNCRFLQGPGTAPESVQRVRDGLNSGKGCTELLLNYRRNGEPFYCLLCIIPLRDAAGSIAYFIGGQTNVTGLLTSEKSLSFLFGGEASSHVDPTAPKVAEVSPTMQMYKQRLMESDSNLTFKSATSGKKEAAGVQSQMTLGEATGSTSGFSLFSNRTNDYTSTINTPNPGFFGKLFNKSPAAAANVVKIEGKQILAGAESTLNGQARSIEDQLTLFHDTYSKVIIFKQVKREITFVTPQMLAYLGLPCTTSAELYSSPIIGSDVTSCLTGGEKAETKRLRTGVKEAIRKGQSLSVTCGIKFLGRNKYFGRSDYMKLKVGMMHLTPLKDRDGVTVAFVAIFS